MKYSKLLALLSLLCASVVAAGEVTTFEYDAQGRLIKTSKSGGPVDGQQKCTDYDAAGNRTSREISASGCIAGGGGGGSAPSFTINDPSAVLEGGTIVFTVTKSGAGAASVSYATANGTATTADYAAKSGTLSFASGDTSKTISVTTYADSVMEPTETFKVNLSNATGGATISDAQGTGTIYNDDSGSCSPICQ